MKPAVDLSGFADAELRDCFSNLVSVVFAVVREDGRLLGCNEGFRRLLEMDGQALPDNVADFFVQPRFKELVAVRATHGQLIHCGVITVGDAGRVSRSLIGAVHCDGSNLILVAEYDVVEMENLNAQVVLLNERLVETQRELARSERRLRQLTITDPLTGLANRRRLDERLIQESQRAQRRGETFSIIMADIDHFKRVNDRHGHDVGDEVLKHFATVLRGGIREIDLAARLGGEEFVVVMPAEGVASAMSCAERLRAATEAMQPLPKLFELSASFGVAQYQPEDTIHGLLKHADEALYAAKNAGRNRVEAYAPPPP